MKHEAYEESAPEDNVLLN